MILDVPILEAYTGDYRPPTLEEIRGARKKRLVVAMYTVYGDESHDSNQEKVFAVSGIIGTQEEWDAIETKWLNRTGGKVIHAADLESDKGDFKNIPHEDNLRLYRDLVNIIADSPLMGYGAAMDIMAYKDNFPNIENLPYIHCFRRVIHHFTDLAHTLIPQGKIKFNFHINSKIQFTAAELFDVYCDIPDNDFDKYLDEISYARMDKVGIQIADLYAREIMKYGLGYFNEQPVLRASFKRLMETKRFKAEYFVRSYWENYKNKLPEIGKIANTSWKELFQWLKDKGLADNLVNRIKFVAFINERDRKKQKDD